MQPRIDGFDNNEPTLVREQPPEPQTKECDRCSKIIKAQVTMYNHVFCSSSCSKEWVMIPVTLSEITVLDQFMQAQFKNALRNNDERTQQINGTLDKLKMREYMQHNPQNAAAILGHLLGAIVISPEPHLTQLILAATPIVCSSQKGEDDEAYLEILNQIEDYLKEHPEAVNEMGTGPVPILIEVACSGLEKAVDLLLRYNPDTTLTNFLGETAAKRCRKMGYNKIADKIDDYSRKKGYIKLDSAVEDPKSTQSLVSESDIPKK